MRLGRMGVLLLGSITAALVTSIVSLGSTPVDTLVIGVIEEPETLDPAIDYTFGSIPMFRASYERLVNWNSHTGKVEPELAVAWEVSEDNKVYTFYLRPNVKFHDGAEFNAKAVKIAYERVMTINQGPAWMLTSYVDSIDVIDDLTVRFILKSPFVPFIKMLTSYWAMCIPSPKAILEHADDLGQGFFRDNIVGTGPYRLVSWTRGWRFVFERFEGYWRGWDGKHVDRVIIQKVLDTTTMAILLEQGQLDIAYGIPVAEVSPLTSNPNLKVLIFPTFTTNMIAMNTTKEPLNNVLVRRALSYSFPYEDAVQVFGGYVRPLPGPLPPGMLGYNEALPHYVLSLEKAKQLLAEAGYPDGGFTLEYTWVTEEPEGRRIGVLWQEQLRKLGIDLKITEVTVAAHWARISDPATTPDLANYRWGIDYPDPSSILLPLYHGNAAPPVGYNISRHSNARVNELLDMLITEKDEKKVESLLLEIQTLLLEDAPNIWIAPVPVAICLRANVYGFIFEPAYFSGFNVYNIWKE